MLMIKNLYDVESFVNKFNNYKAEPLLVLTNGIHLHTILTDNEEQMSQIVEGMDISPENMEKNLYLTQGLVFSQRVLLELVEKFKLSREDAYAVVQENAMKCWHGEGSFADLLWSDSRVNRYLSRDELDKLFDIDYYFKAIDEIFLRFSE